MSKLLDELQETERRLTKSIKVLTDHLRDVQVKILLERKKDDKTKTKRNEG